MQLQQPSIEIWGLQINEIVTSGTDLIVAAVCLYAFLQLRKIPKKTKLKSYLLVYFLLMSIATTLGGLIGHAFLWYFDTTWTNPAWITNFIDSIPFLISQEPAYAWKLPAWIISMLSVMFVERAAIEQLRNHISSKLSSAFRIVNMVELCIFMLITLVTLNFKYVEIHSGYGLMFVVLSLQGYAYLKTKNKGNKLFIIGVGIAAVAALFYMFEIGIGKWFNHLDISHILMAISAYVFYRGSKILLLEKT